MMRARTPLLLLAAAAGLATVLGCPTVKLLSVAITSVGKDDAVFAVQIQVDNPDPDTSSAAALSVGVDPSWTVEEIRYQIPGEALIRRARPAPAVAVQADWVYTADDVAWWGFKTSSVDIPQGTSTYTIDVHVSTPRRAKAGPLALVIGDPGPDAAAGRYEVQLRPKRLVSTTQVLALNPDNQMGSASEAGGDLQDAISGLSEGTPTVGEDLENLPDFRELGTLLGLDTGARGYREPWIDQRTEAGAIRLAGATLALPDDWSVIGDPPTGPEMALVIMPPGTPCVLGVEIVPDLDEALAHEVFEREITTALQDFADSGTPGTVADVERITPLGRKVAGKEIHYTDDLGPGRLLMLERYGNQTLVLAVTFGDPASMAIAEPYLDTLVDSVVFE
jgi:hypothetical protein